MVDQSGEKFYARRLPLPFCPRVLLSYEFLPCYVSVMRPRVLVSDATEPDRKWVCNRAVARCSGKAYMCSFLQELQLAIRRSASHRTAIFDIANCGCSCVCRKLEVRGCTEAFTRHARSYEIQKSWYWLRYLFLILLFLFTYTYKSTNSQQRLQSIYQFG